MYKIGLITLCLLVMSSLTYGQKHKQQDPYSDVTRQNQVLFNQIMIKPPVTPDYQPQSESGNRMVTMRRCPVKGCRIIYVSSDYY